MLINPMRADQQRAAQLWRDLRSATDAALDSADHMLTPLEVGFIMHEFAVGLIALGSERVAVMTFLANIVGDIGRDELAVTNSIFGRDCPKGRERERTDIGHYSGASKSHQRWRDEQFRVFHELAKRE